MAYSGAPTMRFTIPIALFAGSFAAATCDSTDAGVKNISNGFADITFLVEQVRLAFMADHVHPDAIRASLQPLETSIKGLRDVLGTTCLNGDQVNQLTASSVNLINEIGKLGFTAVHTIQKAADDGNTDELNYVVREIMYSVRTLVDAVSQSQPRKEDRPLQIQTTLAAIDQLISVL